MEGRWNSKRVFFSVYEVNELIDQFSKLVHGRYFKPNEKESDVFQYSVGFSYKLKSEGGFIKISPCKVDT